MSFRSADRRAFRSKRRAVCVVAHAVLVGAWRLGAAAFGRLNAAGSPKLAVLASSFGIVVAIILQKWVPKNAFVSVLGGVLTGMLLSWLVGLAAHVKFRQQLSPDQLAALPMRSPLGAWGSGLGFVLIIFSILEIGWSSHLTLISGAAYISGDQQLTG